MKIAALALAGLAASGCSFAFVHGPPPHHEQSPSFDCTSYVVAPVLDAVWAGLNGFGAINAAATDQATWDARTSTSRGGVIAVGLGWLVLSGASAIYGFKTTADCRAALADLELRTKRGAPPPPASFVPAPAMEGCARDTDCKGDRVCVQRECVAPK